MTSQNRTYYEILGVSEDASFEEIRAAFRERAREYHPDRNPSPGAVERMQEINEAYEVLRDEQERAAYDRAHRTFSASPEALARAKAMAAMVLGQMAFDLGSAIGLRTIHGDMFWMVNIIRKIVIPPGINRLEDIPTGVWHSVYEVTLESVLTGESDSQMRQAALNMSWHAVQTESVRLAYRHALAERAQTFTESFSVDIEVNILGSIAAVIGFALGRQNIQESLPASAWSQADGVIRGSVSKSIRLRGGIVTPQMLRDSSFIDSVFDDAAQEANRVLRPYSEAIGRRIGRSPRAGRATGRDGHSPSVSLKQIVGFVVFIGIIYLLAAICTGLGLV